MLIVINPEETIKIDSNSWNLKYLKSVSLDYGTNTLDCFFENNLHHLINFRDYGITLDNRFNTYEITYGSAGILIEIKKT